MFKLTQNTSGRINSREQECYKGSKTIIPNNKRLVLVVMTIIIIIVVIIVIIIIIHLPSLLHVLFLGTYTSSTDRCVEEHPMEYKRHAPQVRVVPETRVWFVCMDWRSC
jgi:hypothetical protein